MATPFDAWEIAEIAVAEFRNLSDLGPLQGGKEYAYFELQFEVHIKLLLGPVKRLKKPKRRLAGGHVKVALILARLMLTRWLRRRLWWTPSKTRS